MKNRNLSLPGKLFVSFGILLIISLILILAFVHHIFNQRINDEIYLRIHNGGKTAMNSINNDFIELQRFLKDTDLRISPAAGPIEESALENLKEICADRKIDFLCFNSQTSGTAPLLLCGNHDPNFCSDRSLKEATTAHSNFGVRDQQGKTLLMAQLVSKRSQGLWLTGVPFSTDYLNTLQNLTGMDIVLLSKNGGASLSTFPNNTQPFRRYSNLPEKMLDHLERFAVYSFEASVKKTPYQFIFYPLIGLEDELVGTLGIGFSLQQLHTANQNTYTISMLFIVSVVLTFLALSILTARYFLQPLVVLKNMVTDFLRREHHAHPIDANDEVSFLDESFKRITEELRTSIQLLGKAQGAEKKAQRETLLRLAIAAEYKDQETAAHILQLSRYCEIIARHVGLPEDEIEILRDASPMHDIGKIGIPDTILQKRGPLTPTEFEIMKSHAKIGAGIFKNAKTALYEACRVIALTHHEKFDGTGYPQGLRGEEIPLYGRIVAVADVFDALTSERYYKPAYNLEKALVIMRENTGSHFDPKIMEAFNKALPELIRVMGLKERDLTSELSELKNS